MTGNDVVVIEYFITLPVCIPFSDALPGFSEAATTCGTPISGIQSCQRCSAAVAFRSSRDDAVVTVFAGISAARTAVRAHAADRRRQRRRKAANESLKQFLHC